jgi:multidrug efflux pump subunit AcrA (membrane-fusion protein)
MRIDHRSVSTQPRGWGPAADAPTFLPKDDVVLPLAAPRSDSVITSAPKTQKRARLPEARAVQQRTASQSTIKPAQQGTPAPPAQQAAVQAAAQRLAGPSVPAFIPFEGGASFDPLAIPLPPELAPPVYSWLRRLALQADLAGADRLLREAFADLTSALHVLVIYASPEGLHSVGVNDELPKDMQPIIAVAKSRRALVGTHSALIPITTTTETIAVIQLVRNVRQPAFNMIEHVTMAALARESASIMHHLVVEHLQRRNELEADKKSLYRPEALEQHRRRGQEGALTELSPGWIRATYRILVGGLVLAVVLAFVIHVPTYSEGTGVTVYPGTPLTAPAPGTVDKVFVQAQHQVKQGTPLVKLKSEKEESDERQARTELEAALQSYLFDPADESIRKALVTAQATAKRTEEAIEQRTVRASIDGVVSDVRVTEGKAVNFGDPIVTIVPPGTEPEVWAFLPGSDRPRLRAGQTLQVELLGYQKVRERAAIYDIALTTTGAAMARTLLGPELADSLKLAPDAPYVLVKAKLPRRMFRAKGKTYRYHQGMPAKTEVRVEDKRFISTLLPSLEKYTE